MNYSSNQTNLNRAVGQTAERAATKGIMLAGDALRLLINFIRSMISMISK